MIAVFAYKKGKYSIKLPSHIKRLTGLFTKESYENMNDSIEIDFVDNECKCFLVN